MLIKRTAVCPEFRAVDATRLREVLHPRNDGGELPFSVAVARLSPGDRSLPHTLTVHEAYYVLTGRGRMHIDDEVGVIGPGDAVHIPPGTVQWLECLGSEPIEFMAIVAPPWREEFDLAVGPARAARSR
jgi:mannose-6-phosphate isomerase-like protein (cupin superfamily)